MFPILRRTERNIITNVHRSSSSAHEIQSNVNFLDTFSKNFQISVFMKIRLIGAELFYSDGWMDMTKPTVAFRNLAKAPKKIKPSNKAHLYSVIIF
jgi:hypothetical protein